MTPPTLREALEKCIESMDWAYRHIGDEYQRHWPDDAEFDEGYKQYDAALTQAHAAIAWEPVGADAMDWIETPCKHCGKPNIQLVRKEQASQPRVGVDEFRERVAALLLYLDGHEQTKVMSLLIREVRDAM